jgi:hypothetical protein
MTYGFFATIYSTGKQMKENKTGGDEWGEMIDDEIFNIKPEGRDHLENLGVHGG